MSKTSYGAQSIESKITNLLKPLFDGNKKEFLIINNLVKNWEKIIGKKYTKLCYPKSINFSKSYQKNTSYNAIQKNSVKSYDNCTSKSAGHNKNLLNSSEGKLTIAVYNASVGFFLENNSEFLLEKIASLYGYKAIHKIIIKQEPRQVKDDLDHEIILAEKDEKNLQESLKNIEDVELAKSLATLGRMIKKPIK